MEIGLQKVDHMSSCLSLAFRTINRPLEGNLKHFGAVCLRQSNGDRHSRLTATLLQPRLGNYFFPGGGPVDLVSELRGY